MVECWSCGKLVDADWPSCPWCKADAPPGSAGDDRSAGGSSEQAGSRRELAGLDLDRLPSIVSHALSEYANEENPVLRLWAACDAVELVLRLLVIVGVSEATREDGRLPVDLGKQMKGRIEEPTLGKWRGMATAIADQVEAGSSVVPELPSLVNDVLVPLLDGPAERSKRIPENSLTALRNRLAHGGGVTRRQASSLLAIWENELNDTFAELKWLEEMSLISCAEDGGLVALQGTATGTEEALLGGEVEVAVNAALRGSEGVVMVRGDSVLPVWPLTLHGRPRSPDPELPEGSQDAAQVYVRRGEVGLLFTPLGSDEVAQSEADEGALDEFRRIFRLDEAEAERQKKGFEVSGFESDIHQDAGRLIGRVDELDRLRGLITATDEGVLWLTGPAGIGKSYIVARIAAENLDEPPSDTIVLPYRFKAGDERCTRRHFLQFAIERLKAEGVVSGGDEDKGKQKRPLDELKGLLKSLDERRVLFILDGLDEVALNDNRFAEKVPLSLTDANVTWLCAGRPEQGLPEAFSEERCTHVFPESGGVPGMDAGDIRSMLLEKVGPLRRRLIRNDEERGDEVVNPFIERVAERADGYPIYVTYVIGDILCNRLGAMDAREGHRLPPTLEAYHEELLRRLGVGDLQQVLTPIACTMAIAKGPMTADCLAALLRERRLVPEGEEGRALVHRGLSAIASMLRRAMTPEGEEGYTLFHHSLREHMQASPTCSGAIKTSRETLEEAALEIREGPAAPYLFRHGIVHLMESERRDDAISLLTDFDFLMQRLASTDDQGLNAEGADITQDDWRLVLEQGPLDDRRHQLWEDFWRTTEHLLRRGDLDWPANRILLQTAIEHADDSPVTISAEVWLEDENNCDWLWLKKVNRPRKVAINPCIRVLEGHSEVVMGASELSDGRILS